MEAPAESGRNHSPTRNWTAPSLPESGSDVDDRREVLAPLVGQVDQHTALASGLCESKGIEQDAPLLIWPGRPNGLPMGKFTNTDRGGRTCAVRSRPVDTSTVGIPASSMIPGFKAVHVLGDDTKDLDPAG